MILPSSSLRVMTFNLYEGAAGRESALLRLLRAVRPDLLFLQEVLSEVHAQQLSEQLDMHLSFGASNSTIRNLALLSRYPLLDSANIRPFPLLRGLLRTTVRLPDGSRLNLYGVHLGVIHDFWRVLELVVIRRAIQQHEQAHPAPYALIAGDFNAVRPGDPVRLSHGSVLHRLILALQFRFATRFAPRLLPRYVDCYRRCHPTAPGFTFPVRNSAARLDYILASPPLAASLSGCDVLTHPAEATAISDHFPLAADFNLALLPAVL